MRLGDKKEFSSSCFSLSGERILALSAIFFFSKGQWWKVTVIILLKKKKKRRSLREIRGKKDQKEEMEDALTFCGGQRGSSGSREQENGRGVIKGRDEPVGHRIPTHLPLLYPLVLFSCWFLQRPKFLGYFYDKIYSYDQIRLIVTCLKTAQSQPAFSFGIFKLIPRSGCRLIIAFFFFSFALPPARFVISLVLSMKTFTYLPPPSFFLELGLFLLIL